MRLEYKLKYSPDASDKLRELNKQIAASYGKPVAARIVSKLVTDIYNERENFMWRMFRVNLRTQDSIDFWGE